MLNIRFSISPSVNSALPVISQNHNQIKTAVIPRAALRQLQWDAILRRLKCYIKESDTLKVTDETLVNLLNRNYKLKANDPLQMLLNYRDTLLYVWEDWFSIDKALNYQSLAEIVNMLTYRIKKPLIATTIDEKNIHDLLAYTQTKKEHPVVTASILVSQLTWSDMKTPINPFTTLLIYLILSKEGYDFNKLLVLEEEILKKRTEYLKSLKLARDSGDCSRFIDCISQIILTGAYSVYDSITAENAKSPKNFKHFMLSQRQRDILSMLEEPGSSITNRHAKKLLGISQITASRELSKLSSMGLLYPHGAGRSVFYTKI